MASSSYTGSLTPTQALRNGKSFIDQRVWYSQCGRANYFRIDCVGFIGRAWNLDIMTAFTTDDLRSSKLSNGILCACVPVCRRAGHIHVAKLSMGFWSLIFAAI